jgi:hypothetical protein
MKQAVNMITGWLNEITDLLKAMVIIGVFVGILFNDYFGVIAGISTLMSQFGQEGLAGLVALVLVVSWYKK